MSHPPTDMAMRFPLISGEAHRFGKDLRAVGLITSATGTPMMITPDGVAHCDFFIQCRRPFTPIVNELYDHDEV
jgi:hypothetical protein